MSSETTKKLLRIEALNQQTPIEKKPAWIKTTAKIGPEYQQLHLQVKQSNLHTVCEEAGCPNIFECWEDREATFLIGGDTCTRRCDFCQINSAKPLPIDPTEPLKIALNIKKLKLKYATVTGVARDDLADGGAWLYAETVRQIKNNSPTTGVELLIPDFGAKSERLQQVFATRPHVLAHNIETIPRLFKRIRPAFSYQKSLQVIASAKEYGLITKSNIILGMGEKESEVPMVLQDLYNAGCDIVTITQYLRPSKLHLPVDRWVTPQEFVRHTDTANQIGFSGVMAGPLVRSSYRAGKLYAQSMLAQNKKIPDYLQHLATAKTARQEASYLLNKQKIQQTSQI